jgi:NADH-quinone oxidoreductase subunit N
MFNLSDLLNPLDLQTRLYEGTLLFLPELILCAAIVLLLLLRLRSNSGRDQLGGIALLMTLLALGATIGLWVGAFDGGRSGSASSANPTPEPPAAGAAPGAVNPAASPREVRASLTDPSRTLAGARPMFSGLLVYDRLTLFLRIFLFGFTALIIWLTLLTGIPDSEDSADFHTLLLGSVLGMSIMASANHLLMVYIGIEMASLPSYALAGFLKGRRTASEAALKYVVYGGGAAGVMLYGISLLAGTFGTAYLPDLAVALATHVSPAGSHGLLYDPIVLLGTLFILIGIAFKLAAVPFHFWCPDVFEGASAEVAGFLSVASKGAALALLARVTLIFAGLEPLMGGTSAVRWQGVTDYLIPVVGVAAALTATFGNLAAYLQTNLKRLLAYSTIAHAGYMMMGLTPLNRDGAAAVLFYLVGYLFMNLGAFAVIAFLRRETGSEDLSAYRGLVRRSPWMVVTLSLFLLSLLGIPPLVGFAAKFQIFSVLYSAGQSYGASGERGLSIFLYLLLLVGGLNTVISAVYYLKVMKVMILDERVEDVEGRAPVALRERFPAVAFASLVALVVLALGILVNPVVAASRASVDRFRRVESRVPPRGNVRPGGPRPPRQPRPRPPDVRQD